MEMKIIVLSRNIITKKEHVLKQSSTTTWLSFSRSSVCNELNIRFSNYVQRSCRKKIKGISGNNNTSNRMLTGLVFFRRGKKESRFLDLVANRTWCVVLNPMRGIGRNSYTKYYNLLYFRI